MELALKYFYSAKLSNAAKLTKCKNTDHIQKLQGRKLPWTKNEQGRKRESRKKIPEYSGTKFLHSQKGDYDVTK